MGVMQLRVRDTAGADRRLEPARETLHDAPRARGGLPSRRLRFRDARTAPGRRGGDNALQGSGAPATYLEREP